mgnify:CR=1 FL=1
MNYDTLFPKILKQLPKISYNQTFNSCNLPSRNNKINIFFPKSKKYLLWFTKFNGENYALLLTMRENKVIYTNFLYIGFDDSLSYNCGTVLYCTKNQNQICCYKVMYYKGVTHNECSTYKQHLNLLNYIYNYEVDCVSSHLKICFPYMSQHRDPILLSTTFSFPVYEIFDLNNNYIKMNDYIAYFNIKCIDHKRDIYELHCNNRSGILTYHCMACVSNHSISHLLKVKFNKAFKNYHHTQNYGVEYNDKEIVSYPQNIVVKCVYVSSLKKWRPIEIIGNHHNNKINISHIKKVNFIEKSNISSNHNHLRHRGHK